MRGVTGIVTFTFIVTFIFWIYSGHVTLFQGQIIVHDEETDKSTAGKLNEKFNHDSNVLKKSEQFGNTFVSKSASSIPVLIQTETPEPSSMVLTNKVSEMETDLALKRSSSSLTSTTTIGSQTLSTMLKSAPTSSARRGDLQREARVKERKDFSKYTPPQEVPPTSKSAPTGSIRHGENQTEADAMVQNKFDKYSEIIVNQSAHHEDLNFEHKNVGITRSNLVSLSHKVVNNSLNSAIANQTFTPEFGGHLRNSTLNQVVETPNQNVKVQVNSNSSSPYLNASKATSGTESLGVEINPTMSHINTTMVPDPKGLNYTASNMSTSKIKLPTCPERMFTDNKTRIVLYTKKRSGSSFTLDILRTHPDMYTMFEPLMLVLPERYTFMDNVSREFMLNNVLQCDFHTNISNHLIPMDRYHTQPFGPVPQAPSWVKNKFWGRLCINAKAVLKGSTTTDANSDKSAKLVEDACKQQKYLAIKVIRFTNLESLHCALQSGVKIIYLVRDLRGIINSRISLDLKEHRPLTSEVDYIWEIEKYCRELDSDIRYLHRMNEIMPEVIQKNLLVLRYEDLAVNPLNMTKLVYDFLDVDLHQKVVKFIKENTNVDTTKSKDSYSTARKSSEVAQSWKYKLDRKYIEHVQRICGDSLKLLGYKLVHNDVSLQSDLVGEIQDDVLKKLSKI